MILKGIGRVALSLWCAAAATVAGQRASLIANCGFDRDVSGWSAWYSPGQAEGGVRWVARDDGGAMEIRVERRDKPTAVQIYQGPFTIRQGAWYAVSFEAKAKEPTTMRLAMIRHTAPYGGLGLSTEVAVGEGWSRFSLLVQASKDSDNARIDFFPAVTTWLDSVSIRELGELPDAWPVKAVKPGPGWRGNAATLIDGKPGTSLASRYYPVLPLLLTLDLGQMRPVGAVVVDGIEYGRHNHVRRMAVEVSANASDWFRWALASKTSEGGVATRRTTRFVASSVAVPARYVRLRITRLRGGARLAEAKIIRAEAADPAVIQRLPRVLPEDDLAFQGWDYDRLGYALSPGEPFALRFTNQGDQPVAAPLAWRLETYAGDELARGKGRVEVQPLATADVPVVLSGALKDGPHRLRFTVGDGEREEAFYFDHRVAEEHDVLSLRVAAVLDCLDPEGWVKLLAGPLAPLVDVRRTLPADPKAVDAALVMAESWPANADVVAGLRRYLRAGGRALFYGKAAPSLADMLPVDIDAAAPWLETPQRLQPPAFWRDFDPERGPRHYGIRLVAKPGAKVLAQWEDGTPAVVEGRFGSGRVLYLGTAPGRWWGQLAGFEGMDELTVRALYHLAGRDGAGRALETGAEAIELRRQAELERLGLTTGAGDAPVRAGAGALIGNAGRFGWLVEEGGLVENLGRDGEMRCPADPTPWRLAIPGRGPFSGRPTVLHSSRKSIEWRDAQGAALTSTISPASPCILWEGAARRVDVTGGATHVAFATRRGTRVLRREERVPGDDLSASWLVLLGSAAPRLVVLTRRPTTLRLSRTLELTFGEGGFGALFTGRLFGLRRFAPGETTPWLEALPASASQQAAALASHCLAFPSAFAEMFWRDGESIVIVNRFHRRTFKDDWNTRPQPLAVLPPVLSLARHHGLPVGIEGKVKSLGVATKYGPLEGVEGDTVRYRLPIPPRDHFGVIPVEGKMALAEAIDRYGVQGIKTVKRSSGGLVTGDPFLADLRAYMGSSAVPPFESPHLDLYKWWYCFPTVLGRPAFGPEARKTVDAHHRIHYWKTLNFYPHKALIRYRREPWTGLDYAVSFIWPVAWRDGVRYFVDQNESASVILYCTWAYGQYYGDWATVRSNWNLCQYVHRYLTRFHDWALMTSSNQEFFSTVGIDMLNSEVPGNLAYARIARQVGDKEAEQLGLYLAAKAAVPTVARLYMPDYIRSITAEGDPWRERKWFWSFSETGLRGSKTMVLRGGSEMIASLAIGMLDTSKGTSPEVCLLYKRFAAERINAYERDVAAFAKEHGVASGWAHLMQRAILGWPRDELIAEARRFHKQKPNWGWQSTKGPGNMAVVCVADTPLFLAEWAPAEYVSGRFTPADGTVRLTLNNREPRPYEVRLYSQRAPAAVRLNDAEHKEWSYDAKTGWLRATLPGKGVARLEIRLGKEANAPLHPYFAK